VEVLLASRFRWRPDVSFRRIDEETWILSPTGEVLHRLNATASRLWELLGEEPTADSLSAALTREFAVDEERARTDTAAFVQSLLEKGLVEVVPDEGAHG
jgi:hypothetical protein